MRTLLLAILFLVSPPVADGQAVDIPRPTGEWVLDQSGVLTADEVALLGSVLQQIEDSTSVQMVVIIMPTTGDRPIGDFAVAPGRAWGVGQTGEDNGVVVLLATEDRQVFIATGYGLEGSIPDAVANRIIRERMVPELRQGDYFGAVSHAVVALGAAAAGTYDHTTAPTGATRTRAVEDVPVFAQLLFFLLIVAMLSTRGGRTLLLALALNAASPRYGGGRGLSRGGFSGGGGSFGGGGAGGSW